MVGGGVAMGLIAKVRCDLWSWYGAHLCVAMGLIAKVRCDIALHRLLFPEKAAMGLIAKVRATSELSGPFYTPQLQWA